MSVMDHPASSLNADRLTLEERDSRDLAALLELYGDQPVIIEALALAWRLGVHRAQQLGPQSSRSLLVNPFWR